MAVDTAAKRRSAADVPLWFLRARLPAPDGTVGDADRQFLLGQYVGILAEEPVTPLQTASTAAQIVTLVEAPDLIVEAGLDLLDADDNFVLDISSDLTDGEVARSNYATIHGTCRLSITRRLQWGSARVRPRLTLTSLTENLTRTVNLGVFLLETPERRVGETPETYQAEGYDKLVVLDVPTGRTVSLAEDAVVLDFVTALIVEAGEAASFVRLDADEAATTAPSTRTWPLDEKTSFLSVVNDCLEMLGYRGLYCDRDGFFRSEPYVAPVGRAPEWTYDADSATTIVGEDRVEEADFFKAPNRWVFIRNDPTDGLPTDGAGIYTVVNQSDGPTSVDGRGRMITRVVRLDAVSQTSLVSQGDRMVDADKRVAAKVSMTSGPHGEHWHMAVLTLSDTALGSARKMVQQSWRLPLNGGDMQHELKEV